MKERERDNNNSLEEKVRKKVYVMCLLEATAVDELSPSYGELTCFSVRKV